MPGGRVLRSRTLWAAAALVALLSADAATAQRSDWAVSPAQSRVVVHVASRGVLSRFLHDHRFVPGRWSGALDFDPLEPERTSGRLENSADSLRDRQPALSPRDRARVERQARVEVLEAGRFPTVSFAFDRFDLAAPPAQGSATGALVDELTLHGTTLPLRVPLTALWSDCSLRASGTMRFRQSRFGIKPNGTALGTLAVRDGIAVEFTVAANRARQWPPGRAPSAELQTRSALNSPSRRGRRGGSHPIQAPGAGIQTRSVSGSPSRRTRRGSSHPVRAPGAGIYKEGPEPPMRHLPRRPVRALDPEPARGARP